jgi:hypothetical protein
MARKLDSAVTLIGPRVHPESVVSRSGSKRRAGDADENARMTFKDWIPVVAALVALAGIPMGIFLTAWIQGDDDESVSSSSSSATSSPTPRPCDFTAKLTDEDPFGILGAHLGYAVAENGARTIVRLAVADRQGDMAGQCPIDERVQFPLTLLVKRAESAGDMCVYSAGQLLANTRNQHFFIDLQVAPPVGTWSIGPQGEVLMSDESCRD